MKAARMKKGWVCVILLVMSLFAGLYLYQEWRIARGFGFPLDDAWIHCQFARNLARGNGMSYNPGVPSSGSTAPLWTIMLAASYLIIPNFVFTAKVMSVVLYALSCSMVFKILIFILDDARFAFLGAVLTAMISTLTWGALSGMEVMLSTFLTLTGIYLHLIYRKTDGPRQYASTAVFALASLARPESMLLVFLALLDNFLVGHVEKREKLAKLAKRAVVHLLLFVFLLCPYFAFNYSINGGPFPNTFAAKRSGGLAVFLSERNMQELWRMVFQYPRLYLSRIFDLSFQHNVLLYWLMFVGMGMIIVRSFRKDTENKALIVPLTFLLYPMISGIVAPNQTALDWIFRYMGNLTPLYVIMGVVGLSVVISFLESLLAEFWVGKELARKVTGSGLIAIVIVLFFSLSVEEYANSKFYARGVENINSMQVTIGRWAKENTPTDAVLAVNDIGAIAYFSERQILDLVGIVTPEILSYRKKRDCIFEFLASRKPDYVIIFPEWFPELTRHNELNPLFSVTLEIDAVCSRPTMTIYKTAWTAAHERVASNSVEERLKHSPRKPGT